VKKGTLVPKARIVVAVAVIAVVVVANQITVTSRSSEVLGLKVERCSVGAVRVDTGSRVVVAQPLSVRIAKGAWLNTLAPAIKVTPGAVDPIVPVAVSLGVRGAGAKRVSVTMAVLNLSDCPVVVSVGRVTSRVGASPAAVTAVRFGGRDRVVLEGGKSATGRAVVPVELDGDWRVEGSTYADVGAAG
jgi:hypothetical protein